MKKTLLLLACVSMVISTLAQYSYKSYKNDPTGVRHYTLKNGMQVYLAQNTDEPKIQTFVAVRAGSTYDPADNTGLAHYLEHMLFKGTDEIGADNWSQEQVYLKAISDLYEKHKKESKPEVKKTIYKSIDSLSYEASKLCIANEYDKMISGIGAEETNAHTWHEETVYKNKIPANELEKWLTIESERFSQVVLRLFHTELEAVYEEFNRAQDNDYRKVHYELMKALFPTHPYGQQTTIGTADDLKNPSMQAIHKYFTKYYVPNNMCMVLVGDLDFDKTIALVDKYFGKYKNQPITPNNLPKEKPLNSIVRKTVSGPTAPSLSMAYRFEGIGSQDEKMVTLIDMILNNSAAGLIDIDLNQGQKVLRAGCTPTFLNDYGYHSFYGNPKQGQTLPEVEALILQEIDKIKKGDFEDWLLEAVINDLKLSRIKTYESATETATMLYDSYIHFQDWQEVLDFNTQLQSITKQQLVDFANTHYTDNYVIVYKEQGENTGIVKVDNPEITPIETNRDKTSKFLQHFNTLSTPRLTPKFVDFDSEIDYKNLGTLKLANIDNPSNDLFYLNYVYDIGSEHIETLPLAQQYFKFLGTDKYSSDEISKEFYKLGINYGMQVQDHRTYFYLSGLRQNMEEGLKLYEHLLSSIVPDAQKYKELTKTIAKERQNRNTNKSAIFWTGLFQKALYDKESPALHKMPISQINNYSPDTLVSMIKDFSQYPHEIFYYGQDINTVAPIVSKYHKAPTSWAAVPQRHKPALTEPSSKVYFYDYDMVQSEIAFVTKDIPLNIQNMALIEVFNAYFGAGLSSIVFQEIRESKSLAYSAFASYATPNEKGDNHLIYAYIGTQANKLPDAVSAMQELLNQLPYSEEQFKAAKSSALKQIEADRITKQSVYWQKRRLADMGIDHDYRKEVYKEIQSVNFAQLQDFFDKHIKGKTYNFIAIGNKKDLDLSALKSLGQVQEVALTDIFVE